MRCSLALHSLHASCFESWVKWVFVFRSALRKAKYALMHMTTYENLKTSSYCLFVTCVDVSLVNSKENTPWTNEHLRLLANIFVFPGLFSYLLAYIDLKCSDIHNARWNFNCRKFPCDITHQYYMKGAFKVQQFALTFNSQARTHKRGRANSLFIKNEPWSRVQRGP